MPELPRGTVTLLFTDVEGSTLLLRELGAERYAGALAEHRRVLRAAFERQGGTEVDTQGDAFFVAFPDAMAAAAAAAEAQEGLGAGPIAVRMGLHTGAPVVAEDGYVGMDVHKAARICAAGHGGQVLVSEATAAFLSGHELQPLGVHRLKDLAEGEPLYQLGAGDFPPVKSLHQTNLPVQTTPFLGRERELADVLSLVARPDTRLVTLTGPGGSGKTRLALQAATELVETYPHGVWWVDLQGIGDPSFVVPTIGSTLGARGDAAEHIADRRLLLVLDNFEHLLEAAPSVGTVLASCPNLRMLVTSRERLRLRGEQEYAVSPFVPEEAVGFFLARGREARRDLELRPEVAEICRQLDHLPLALELAAARLRALSPEQLLAHLEERLAVLTGGPRDAPARQQTLRATIDWSYGLLDTLEQRAFTRLAVFAGGFTLEAAEAVADARLDLVQSLVEKSLVRFDGARYAMLQTIREYAAERLEASGDGEALRRQHAEHFLALAESGNFTNEAEGDMNYMLVIPEHDNLRAALEWCLGSGEAELGLRLAVALDHYWVAADPFEGARWCAALLEASVPPGLRARALRTYGGLLFIVGEFERGEHLYEQSLAQCRLLGDEAGAAHALARMPMAALVRGDLGAARVLARESLDAYRRLGDRKGEAVAVGTLGSIANRAGEGESALELLGQSAELAGEAGFVWWQAGMVVERGECALALGRHDDAERWLREGLALAHRIESRMHVVYTLALLARLAARRGDELRAGRLWGALEREEQRGMIGQWEDERASYAAPVLARAGPGFERALEEGRRLSVDAAVELASAP